MKFRQSPMPAILFAADGPTGGNEDPAPEAGATGAAAPVPEAGATGTVGATGAAPAPVNQDWRDKRMARQAANLAAERQERARLEAENARLKAAGATGPVGDDPRVTDDPEEFDRRVKIEAANQRALDRFNDGCDAVAEAGKKEFPDFLARIDSIRELVDWQDAGSVRTYNTMLAVAMEAGQAHKILHLLGADQNEAARIMSLDPVKMTRELTRMAVKFEAEESPDGDGENALSGRTTSRAPKPITPVGNRGVNKERIAPSDPTRSHQLSTSEWMARRNEEIKARGTRH